MSVIVGSDAAPCGWSLCREVRQGVPPPRLPPPLRPSRMRIMQRSDLGPGGGPYPNVLFLSLDRRPFYSRFLSSISPPEIRLNGLFLHNPTLLATLLSLFRPALIPSIIPISDSGGDKKHDRPGPRALVPVWKAVRQASDLDVFDQHAYIATSVVLRSFAHPSAEAGERFCRLLTMISPRALYSDPPKAKNSVANHPTLLVSWWCTGFALAIILVRLSGRYIRTERLFGEDKVMAFSLIPLLGRMALVHIVMIWGTNNTRIDGLSPIDIHHREIGSRLVLVSRIMYAAFLWTAKFTVSEFLKRLTSQVWRRKYELGLRFIRWFLAVTFIAVVIATLAECQPFNHYWQVVPDPGAKCRQGYAQLITMGTSDVITDLLLVGFPIPIVLKSHMVAKRKVSLVLLFSLSLILIGITIFRVIEVVHRHSDQQFRSLVASLEILAAAAVSNALVLGSFVRDRGVKKQRYRFDSVGGNSSLDRAGTGMRPRTLTIQTWGSDADLAGELGMRMAPDLEKQQSGPSKPRPAPIAFPPASYSQTSTPNILHSSWNFPNEASEMHEKTDLELKGNTELLTPSPGEVETITPRRTSFFDVGGLLEGDTISPAKHRSPEPSIPEITPATSPPGTTDPVSMALEGARKGSNAFMSDIGGLQSFQNRQAPVVRNFSRPTSPEIFSPQVTPTITRASHHHHTRTQEPSASTLRDVGGLLD